MAFVIKDRVRETTTTTGISAISLGGTSTSFEAFGDHMSNADTTHYAIVHSTADEWEVGLGTWNTGNTLTRTTVLSSSNSNAAVSFTSGSKDVFMTYPATKSINKDTGKADIDALGINASSVSGFTVGVSVPSNALFTDTNTTYSVGNGGLTQNNFTNADHTKLDGIEASADVTDTDNVVAALTAGTNITIAANGTIASTASGGTSYTHPNHSGEVTSTGDGATVIASNVVDADNLKVTGNGSNTQFLRSDGDGTFTWATPVDTNTTYSIGDGGLTQKNFTTTLKTKLDNIESGATADQTKSDIDGLGINATSVSGFTVGKSVPSNAVFTDTTYSVGDGGLTTNDFTNADHTKLDGIAASANNYTHPNHSGEVTSTADGATVISDNVVDEANLKVSNTPTNGYVLTAQSGNTGGLTWAAAASGGGADLYTANESSPTAQPSATGTNSIAIGDSAISTNTNSFALGKARSVGIDSISAHIGSTSTSYGATNNNGIAIGYYASAGTASVCIGYGSYAGGSHSYAIGRDSSNGSYSNTYSFGHSIFASASNQVNIAGAGQDVRISETYTLPKVDGTASGQVLTTDGSGAVSWATPASGGGGADLYAANESSPTAQPSATGTNAIAIGDSAISLNSGSVAIGKSRASTDAGFAVQINSNGTSYGASGVHGSTAIGNTAKATGSAAIALGQESIASGSKALAFGKTATASSANSVAIGYNSVANVNDGVAIGGSGKQVKISGTYTLPTADGTASGQVMTTNGSGVVSWATPASGGGSPDLYAENPSSATAPVASGTNAVSIGSNSTATGNNSFAIGLGDGDATGSNSFAVGGQATNSSAIAIANGSSAQGYNSVSIGSGSRAQGMRAVALGSEAKATTNSNAIAIGWSLASGASSFAAAITNNTASYGATGANSIAIGQLSKATQANSIAIGDTAISTTANQIALGGATDTVKISNSYTLPTSDGTANQVLTTDGSGAVTFATPASGGGGGITTGKAIAMAMVFG